MKYDDVHKAVAFLMCDEGSYPSWKAIKRDQAKSKEDAEAALYELIHAMPIEAAVKIEDRILSVICKTEDEAYENGFRAGIRFIIQAVQGGAKKPKRTA